MPTISQRGKTVPLSPFRKLIPFADRAKAEGKHVYHLNIGQPDIETPAYALEKVQRAAHKIVAYSNAVGNLSYRQKLVGYYKKWGIDISEENVIVTTGGSEALQLLFYACMNPGDEIIIPEPFYANYNGFAQIAGVNIKSITCKIEDGFALPSVQDFEKLITPNTKAICITNPNNPTGCLYPKSALEQIALLVEKYDLFLIADEVYREFCFDGSTFHSVLNLENISHNTIVIDSISKRYSACGARVGTLVTRHQDVLTAITKYAKLRLSPPFYGQILAEAALEMDDTYINGVFEEYDRRRQVIYERLSSMKDVVTYKPGGAFYCFAKFPIMDADHFCQWLLEEFEYKGATVMLSPGMGFYATPGLGKDEVRLAFVLNSEDLHAAMDCLEKALEVYPHKKDLISVATIS